MTISFTRTREQLGAMILRKLGKLATGQTASPEDSDIVYEALDLYLKQIHRLGIFWRKVGRVPLQFTVSAGSTVGSASADVLFPITMTGVNVSADDPIEIIDIKAYAEISNKTYTGFPTKALHNGSSSFIFWPIPLSNTTIKLTYEKVIDDTASSTAPDVDVAMLRWIRDIIAYYLADDFGISEQTIMRWKGECDYAEKQIMKLSTQNVDNTTVEFCNY